MVSTAIAFVQVPVRSLYICTEYVHTEYMTNHVLCIFR